MGMDPRAADSTVDIHDLIESLTRAIAACPGYEVDDKTGGPAALEFALHRAIQHWDRGQSPRSTGEVVCGVAADLGVSAAQARELAAAIEHGLDAVGDDAAAGRQWLRAIRGYARAAAREVASEQR